MDASHLTTILGTLSTISPFRAAKVGIGTNTIAGPATTTSAATTPPAPAVGDTGTGGFQPATGAGAVGAGAVGAGAGAVGAGGPP